MSFTYVACPYSHPNPHTRELRFHLVNQFSAFLQTKGVHVFSPISHSHMLAKYLPDTDYYRSWDFWRGADFALLEKADRLMVLMLPGWENSVGVTAEIDFARAHNIPVEYSIFRHE